MSKETKHRPLPPPYYVNTIADQIGDIWSKPANCAVVQVQIVGPQQCADPAGRNEIRKATTEFVVTAVNSHAALIEALEYIVSILDQDDPDSWVSDDRGGAIDAAFDKATAALAAAKGGEDE